MELSLLELSYTSLALLYLLYLTTKYLKNPKPHNLPPTPLFKLPIVGHLHLLSGRLLHHSLHSLSSKLGPIFSLQFGSRHVVVITSSSLFEECFTKNDIILANRPRLTVGKYLGYNNTSIAQSPYGDHWRNLRRVVSLAILSTPRVNSFAPIRRDEINHLLSRLSSHKYNVVDLRANLDVLMFNVVMRMVGGKSCHGSDSEDTERVMGTLKKLFKLGGASNVADFLPILNWMGFEKRVKRVCGEVDKLLVEIIEERRKEGSRNSMVDYLLDLQKEQPEYYTDDIIKGLMALIILAGTDTSSVTIEWAMALLLNHPTILKKARDEIDTTVGHDRLVEESDLPNLHFLQNIISETFRLKPAAPLLVPHVPSSDCTIGGYIVPRGTFVLFNAWAIHRDPHNWAEPMSFKPERFENVEPETHKLMPFGMGRRSCPGVGLALRIIGLTLGSLIQCFEWERVSDKEIDLSEGRGISMPKAEPLVALCKSREIMDKFIC